MKQKHWNCQFRLMNFILIATGGYFLGIVILLLMKAYGFQKFDGHLQLLFLILMVFKLIGQLWKN